MRFSFGVFAFLIVFSASSVENFALSADSIQSQALPAVDPLSQAVEDRISRVSEFEFIRKEAQRLGVRAWLFGGTAAAYAHYVKWDLERENGDARYQKDRFDYDYTNIYRSTQDLDIVVDGPPDKAHALQASLARDYPHLQGSKTAWEVRLLRQDLGDKQALLHNPDFLNQHTDSNSTGMIEITKPPAGEPVIRDLRDWDSKDPFFLRDVQEGKIHYYFSPKHGETSFFRAGRNPPILSVVRYLTKAFQYGLKLREEDLAQIKQIVDAFDPHGPEMRNDYVRFWLLKKDNGRKLLQAAIDIEYAWKTLDELGLRQKLMAIENNPQQVDSLAWWMNKQPLFSKPLGEGTGKTARELAQEGRLPKDLVVAHETNNFMAYESITKAHTGDPNVFISRSNQAGEAAAYGNGFYTAIGRKGARGTNLTIRFRLNPEAREGPDADFIQNGTYVIVRNKNAFKVIPESLNLGPVDYFRFLMTTQLDASDLGIMEKLKRRIKNKIPNMSDETYRGIVRFLLESGENGDLTKAILNEWAALPKSANFTTPELKEQIETFQVIMERTRDGADLRDFLKEILPKLQGEKGQALTLALIHRFNDIRDSTATVIEQEVERTLIQQVFNQPHAHSWENPMIELISQTPYAPTLELFAREILNQPGIPNQERIAQALIGRFNALRWKIPTQLELVLEKNLVQILSQPYAQDWKNAMTDFINWTPNLSTMRDFAQAVLTRPEMRNHEAVARALIGRFQTLRRSISRGNESYPDEVKFEKIFIKQVLSQPHAQGWTGAMTDFISGTPYASTMKLFAQEILSKPGVPNEEQIAQALIRKFNARKAKIRTADELSLESELVRVLSLPHAQGWKALAELESSTSNEATRQLIANIRSKPTVAPQKAWSIRECLLGWLGLRPAGQ